MEHSIHYAPASLQVIADPTLVDSCPHRLPWALYLSVADLPNPSIVSLDEQNDSGREIEHQPKHDLQRG